MCLRCSLSLFLVSKQVHSLLGNHLEQKHTHLHIDFVNALFIYFLFGVGVSCRYHSFKRIKRAFQIDSYFFFLSLSLVLFRFRFISFRFPFMSLIQSNDKAARTISIVFATTTTTTSTTPKGNCITFLLIANYLFGVCVCECMWAHGLVCFVSKYESFIIRLSTSKNSNYFLSFPIACWLLHQPTNKMFLFRMWFSLGDGIHWKSHFRIYYELQFRYSYSFHKGYLYLGVRVLQSIHCTLFGIPFFVPSHFFLTRLNAY